METLAISLPRASLKKPQSAGDSRLSQFSLAPCLRALVHVGAGKGELSRSGKSRGARTWAALVLGIPLPYAKLTGPEENGPEATSDGETV